MLRAYAHMLMFTPAAPLFFRYLRDAVIMLLRASVVMLRAVDTRSAPPMRHATQLFTMALPLPACR